MKYSNVYHQHREGDTQEILLESYDAKVDRNMHKTLKNSIPSCFLESDTSEHMCRLKLDEVLKQNDQLKSKIHQIQYQNDLLTERNRQLEHDLRELVSEISEQPLKTPNFATTKLYTHAQDEEAHVRKYKTEDKLHNIKNMRKMVDNLNSENLLLIQIKQVYARKNQELENKNNLLEGKLRESENKIKNMELQWAKQREENANKSRKLQEQYIYNKQNERNITKLEKMLKDASEELNYLSYQAKLKEDQIREHHEKFHRELDRMKDKVEKYKTKAQGYRNQRDQFALQIQKAKLELGAVTLRKYFPEESEG